MNQTALQEGNLKELRAGFQGDVVLPKDQGYDSARRIWNSMIDKRPALIARCLNSSDVVRSVNFARDNGLLLAVRGGGHNIAGSALVDGGVVIRPRPLGWTVRR
jgi:FAD/FMN-containing dehydrogenase